MEDAAAHVVLSAQTQGGVDIDQYLGSGANSNSNSNAGAQSGGQNAQQGSGAGQSGAGMGQGLGGSSQPPGGGEMKGEGQGAYGGYDDSAWRLGPVWSSIADAKGGDSSATSSGGYGANRSGDAFSRQVRSAALLPSGGPLTSASRRPQNQMGADAADPNADPTAGPTGELDDDKYMGGTGTSTPAYRREDEEGESSRVGNVW